jgi:hypothetical protein
MNCRIALAAAVLAFFAFLPVGFAQTAAESGTALAPTRNPEHPTSSESLAAQAQDLTRKIQEARAQGRDTSTAASEQAKGEQAMQSGNSQEALRHFEAGEQALGMAQPQSAPAH